MGEWEQVLGHYWDKQVIHLTEFGFPLDFNRICPLKHDFQNHSFASDFPADIKVYLQEGIELGAIIGLMTSVRSQIFIHK